jgi:3-methyladenine DNA glycosylase AlkD
MRGAFFILCNDNYVRIMESTNLLIMDLKNQFEQHENVKLAESMSAYMKNKFPFLGIQKPIRSELESSWVRECKLLNFDELKSLVLALWQLPEREYQYTALVLMRSAKIWKHNQALELLEYLIVTKSWWDTVDALAAQMLGPYFLKYPEQLYLTIPNWKKSENLWLNRCTLIFQLKHKDKTDVELLFGLIRHFAPEKEFFIKKAIGWALRELSYRNPELVMDFCNREPLQNLSKSEALKALKRTGKY